MTNDYPVQRRLKKEKLRRKVRRGEIVLRRIYKLIRFIFILLIFYSLYRLSISKFWYLSSDTLNPKNGNIEILGNKIVSDEKILNEIKKTPFENVQIYKINPSATAENIEQLSPVKRAYVRRYWLPARIVVMVEEIVPVITVSPSEDAPEIAAFALTGEMIGREYLPLNSSFDAVKILSYGTKGDDYEKWNSEKINDLYRLAKNLEEYSGEKVLYIDLRIPHNAFAQLEHVKIKLGEIDVSVYERIKSIHDILPAIKNLNLKIKYIDLSWKDAKYIKEGD